ncbi:hypothetical protein F4806DRAFT_498292 [Annulohypoxylon nitens]|nr:hypothetical protein F4806DRAFT_498292 [Annulohypoxylon nitens]
MDRMSPKIPDVPHLPPIPISTPQNLGLSPKQREAFPPFKEWLSAMQRSLSIQYTNSRHRHRDDPYILRSIKITSCELLADIPHQRPSFLKLAASVYNRGEFRFPEEVSLYHPSLRVAILVMLIPDDVPQSSAQDSQTGIMDEERYVALTGDAAFTLHTSIFDPEITDKELVCLSDMAAMPVTESHREKLPPGVYLSPNETNERISIYMLERRVPRETLEEWINFWTAPPEETPLRIVKMKDLWREGAHDAKCLAAAALWEGLRREGKL